MITIQKYIRAQSLEEAWQLNQSKTNRVLGGMLWLRLGRGSVNTAIDLCDLGLDKIVETEESFSIGAMATLRDVEMHESLNACFCNAIRDAVKDIVGVQFRNMATIGGSIWGRFGFSDVLTVFQAMDSYVELYKGGIIPLEQFAKMGAIYMERLHGIKHPTVGLLNNGAEETKGTDLHREAYKRLTDTELNFIGNIEGRDIPFAKADDKETEEIICH